MVVCVCSCCRFATCMHYVITCICFVNYCCLKEIYIISCFEKIAARSFSLFWMSVIHFFRSFCLLWLWCRVTCCCCCCVLLLSCRITTKLKVNKRHFKKITIKTSRRKTKRTKNSSTKVFSLPKCWSFTHLKRENTHNIRNINIQDECNLSVINIHYLVKFR